MPEVENQKIGFLGPLGTYTHEVSRRWLEQLSEESYPNTACQLAFDLDKNEIIPYNTIPECVQRLQADHVDYCVIPWENSTNGSVVFTLDVFRDLYHGDNHKKQPEIQVIGEQIVKIRHCVMSKESDLQKIKKVYSHPQVWGQVDIWMKDNMPDVLKVDTTSTSHAVELAANEPESAAIASFAAGQLYNVPVVVSNISNTDNNLTRFLVLTKIPDESAPAAKKPHAGSAKTIKSYPLRDPKREYKTLLCFTIEKSVPGTLCGCLGVFAYRGVNLTWIMSRPSGVVQWTYVFFIEVAGHRDDASIVEALQELETIAHDFTLMGSFETTSTTATTTTTI